MSEHEDRLQRMETKLDDIREQVAELRTIWPSMVRRIDRVEGEIYGNGKTGIIAKINGLLWMGAASLPLITAILAYLIIGKAAL